MKVTNLNSTQNFGKAFVTLSEKNLGNHISKNLVVPFNENVGGKTLQPLDKDTFGTYQDNVDFWALAAGSGSRFKKLADAYTNVTGVPANKISLPIKLNDGNDIHMLDWAMAMARPFAKDGKIDYIIAQKPSGSFGDIVAYNKKVIASGGEIKDTVVCCGDNVFGANPRELDKFVVDVINNPQKQLGLIGVERTPEVVANRFGVLQIDPIRGKKDIVSLTGFAEKPALADAKKMTLPNGNCVANTGMFVIKKDAMKALMEEIEYNPSVIKKNDNEPFDFANAVKWVQKKYGSNASDVKLVKKWEDVGEPKALYEFYNQVKNGDFLGELGKYGKTIKDSISKRFKYDGDNGELLLSNRWNSLDEVPNEVKANARTIEDVKIL